jgi:hypothetical protein
MGVGGQRHAPAALHPGMTRYPSYRRLGGPQGWSGRVRKFSPPPGFDHRTVKPVASRYTDWAIPAHTTEGSVVQFKGPPCAPNNLMALHFVSHSHVHIDI